MNEWNRAWPAPAKLNLFLHVVGRRSDGYHLLQTVFRFIELADTLRFEPRSDGRIVLATPTPGVPPELDLVVRAAEMLKVGAGRAAPGATIHLEKHIPMGGGLGGEFPDVAVSGLGGHGVSSEDTAARSERSEKYSTVAKNMSGGSPSPATAVNTHTAVQSFSIGVWR